jgi:DNA-binding MarR family transcriptional regulator
MQPNDTELKLLEAIYSSQAVADATSQRDLAGASGLSLGMTNALLKRFVEKGWVKLSHLSGHSLKYILTPSGLEEVFVRSISYFSRAVRSASLYREKIDAFVRKAALDGFGTLVLEGPEELDFLFDYSCDRHGLDFVKNPEPDQRARLALLPKTVFVAADLRAPAVTILPLSVENPKASMVQLSTIILGIPSPQNVA